MSSVSPGRQRLSLILFAVAAVIAILLVALYLTEIILGYGSPVGSWLGVVLWGIVAVANIVLIVQRARR